MGILEAIVFGIVQGLTEFIPVSSSGHLLLLHEVFGTQSNSLAFDVALHAGTLLALIAYFQKDVYTLVSNVGRKNASGRLARLLLAATIPAAVAGLLLNEFIEESLRSPLITSVALATVALVMLLADRRAALGSKEVTPKQAMTVGVAQVLALVPGVSRSGITMTVGILSGMGREQAARFSFLLAMPIIAGSALGTLLTLEDTSTVMNGSTTAGVIAAAISGLVAINFLLKYIGRVGLKPFAYYRLLLALIVFLVWL